MLHSHPAPFDKLRVRNIVSGIFPWRRPSKKNPQPELVEGRRLPLQRFLIAAALLLAPIAAHANTIAVLQGLDKTTARVSRFDAPVDQSVRFGTLVITVRACVKKPPGRRAEHRGLPHHRRGAAGRRQRRPIETRLLGLDVRLEPGDLGARGSDLRYQRARLQSRHDLGAAQAFNRKISRRSLSASARRWR